MQKNLQLFAHEAARRIFSNHDLDVKLGTGQDDTALISVNDSNILISTDFVNFKRISDHYNGRDFFDLGRYCVKQNVSDIFGSGGNPRWFLLSALLTKECSEKNVEALFEGVEYECNRLGLTVVGGDTKQGNTVSVHGTIVGTVEGSAWSKGPIDSGWDLFVSGPLSGVTAALCLLEFSPSEEYRNAARQALIDADLPLSCIDTLRKSKIILCASDISDGLGYTIHEFKRVNGDLCLDLDLEDIPLHPLASVASNELGLHERAFCFGFGGDFQMAFVAPAPHRELVESAGATWIGRFHTGKSDKLTMRGKPLGTLPSFGHLDFEETRPVDRFRDSATHFSTIIEGMKE